ncbi:MAG: glycogen/starch synthase [Campylobacterota bacterium]|nr:glycogen/starch synthase [Campylobacterota bacterium]
MPKQRVLFTASEVFPFAKSGGLADVAYSLPRALSSIYDVHVMLPLYQWIDREQFGIKALGEPFTVVMGGVKYLVEIFGCTYRGLEYRFVYTSLLCDRAFLYGTAESAYDDNALRFALFNRAIVSYVRQERYDIIHLNDWQSALIALWIYEDKTIETKTLYTIHNLAYQGIFDASVLQKIGIDDRYFTMDGLEFYGEVNFMKAGIAYADCITTVSPTYAKEILTPAFGCGLEGFLRYHHHKLVGIVNGIDTEHFSPLTDKALIAPYQDTTGKLTNKEAYLKEIGLEGKEKALFIFIARFTWQKGMDILIDALPKLASSECNIAILGEGEMKYHEPLKRLVAGYKNMHLTFGYDESLSHRMYAAADFLFMPSLFEPCGLNQMIAMQYGTIPLVHHTGGLADTVKDVNFFDETSEDGYGIVFSEPSRDAFIRAFVRALALYQDKTTYNEVIQHNMQCDFSWKESANAYHKLYQTMI